MAFTIKQNDLRPYFVVALKDDYGEATEAAVDLSTAGSATFHMRATGGTVAKVSAAGTITNALGGEVTYQWAAGDLDTVGTYEAEMEVFWGDGKNETFPSDGYWTIEVTDDIA